MVDENAPPIVAIVTTHNPGYWLEDCLVSFAEQDYPGFAVLVVDAGSDEPVSPRVAAVTPNFFVLRLEESIGYSASVNAGVKAVEGAAFYLICHDDVILEPDAVRKLAAEAIRQNAAVVGPKLVSVEDKEKLLQVGLDVDKFGAPVRRVGFGELDQAQHDETHETFAVPGACKLIRSDLFATLGGLDEKMTMFGEDIDLSWRAHLAGAKVMVVPSARVAHREATASRQKPLPAARSLQWRHELRSVLKNYSSARLPFILFQFFLLSSLEVGFFLALGRRQRVKHVIRGWRWNIANWSDIKKSRKAISSYRVKSDKEVAIFFTGTGTRARRFITDGLEHLFEQATEEKTLITQRLHERRVGAKLRRRDFIFPLTIALLVILVGSRSFLVGNLPLYGQWLPSPSPTYLLAHFFGGTTYLGSQPPGPVSPAYLFLGILGFIFFGSTTLAVKVLSFVLLFLGAYGVSRIVGKVAKGVPGRPSRVAAALAYMFLPLYFNDISNGRFEAIVCYGAFPYVLLRLIDFMQSFYPGNSLRENDNRNGFFAKENLLDYFSLGLLIAIPACLAPPLLLAVFAVGICLPLSLVVFADYRLAWSLFIRTMLSLAAALLILLPWSITFFQSGFNFSVLFGGVAPAAQAPSLATLMRFDLGPVGSGWLGYAIGVCALIGLTIARRERFFLSSRLLFTALLSWIIIFCFGRGWLGYAGGDLSALLVIPAISAAVMSGISLEAILSDLPGRNFSWRQMVTPVFIVAAFGVIVQVAVAAGPGRWAVPDIGYDTTLSFFPSSPLPGAPRILWVGNPAALPGASHQIGPDLAVAVTGGNLPNITDLWINPDNAFYGPVFSQLKKVTHAETVNYGNVLSRSGVGYVVVLTSLAPNLSGIQEGTQEPVPSGVITGLENQLDLKQLPSEGGALLFKTQPALVAESALRSPLPNFLRALMLAAELIGSWFLILLILRRRREVRRRKRHTPQPVVAVADSVTPAHGFDINLNALILKHRPKAKPMEPEIKETAEGATEETSPLSPGPEDNSATEVIEQKTKSLEPSEGAKPVPATQGDAQVTDGEKDGEVIAEVNTLATSAPKKKNKRKSSAKKSGASNKPAVETAGTATADKDEKDETLNALTDETDGDSDE
jgi:GT2 family glycosyltransferase